MTQNYTPTHSSPKPWNALKQFLGQLLGFLPSQVLRALGLTDFVAIAASNAIKADAANGKHAKAKAPASASSMAIGVLRHGLAMRVVFYYPGEEGAYVDQAIVTLFENGIVHVKAQSEETTTHLSHCEILWKFEIPEGASTSNLRLLKFPESQNNAPKN